MVQYVLSTATEEITWTSLITSFGKILIDKKMSTADLRKAVGIAPNTMTRLRKDEEVSSAVLKRICPVLQVNIGDVMEFPPE